MIDTVKSSNEAQVEHKPSVADRLAAEAATYLEAVELFRSEGHEPRWMFVPRLTTAGASSDR